jgi:hypothetical protein
VASPLLPFVIMGLLSLLQQQTHDHETQWQAGLGKSGPTRGKSGPIRGMVGGSVGS